MAHKGLWRRAAVYLPGVCIYGYSEGLLAAAELGTGPMSSIAVTLTALFPGTTLGAAVIYLNIALVLLQVLIAGRSFPPKYWLQVPAFLLFGFVIDLLHPLVAALTGLGSGLLFRAFLFALGMVLNAVGMSLVLSVDFVPMPGDGLTAMMAQRTKKSYGFVRVIIDCLCVLLSVAAGLIVIRRVAGVQAGTLIMALLVGPLANLFLPWARKLSGTA